MRDKFKIFSLLIAGLMLMAFAVFELQNVWTSRSELVPLKGTLRSADVYTSVVEDSRGHASHKVELIFYLNEFAQKFALVQNIGSDTFSGEYARLLTNLKRVGVITVWVKDAERFSKEPKVFQIDRDDITILDFEAVRLENKWLVIGLLVLGFGSVVLSFWMLYPEKLRKMFE